MSLIYVSREVHAWKSRFSLSTKTGNRRINRAFFVVTIAAANPALAHADCSYHTLGAEVFVLLETVGVAATIFI